jgi:O-antigen/teichoic acid export membrane protein
MGSSSISLGHQVARNSASVLLRAAAGAGFVLLITPYVLHKLGNRDFGLWSLIYAVVPSAALFDFGISGALTRFVGTMDPSRDSARIRVLFTSALTVVILIIALTVPGFVALVAWSGWGGPNRSEIISLTPFISFLYAAALLANLVNYALMGIQRLDLSCVVAATYTAVSGIGVVIVLAHGTGLKGLMVFMACALTAMGVVSWVLFSRRVPGRFSPGLDGRAMRQLIGFGVPLQIYALAGVFYIFLSKTLVAYVLSLSMVAQYEIGLRLTTLLRQGLSSLASPLLPASARLHEQNDVTALRQTYVSTIKYISLLSLPAFAGLAFFSDTIVRLWVGSGYQEASSILRILAPSSYAATLSASTWFFLLGKGSPAVGVRLSLLETFLGVSATLLLARMYGVTGAALGAAIPACVTMPIYLFFYYRKIQYPLGQLLWSGIVGPLSLCLLLGGGASMLSRSLTSPPQHLLTLLAYVAACYAAFVMLGLLNKQEQRRAAEWIRSEYRILTLRDQA